VAQWQGTGSGYTKGRDRSFHFGTNEHHIVGMISHLGPQLCVADGIALAERLQKTNHIVATFTGEGGTSEGDFHEALNVAAVWKLPVIFIVENNGYALSTPTREQFACARIADRAVGYGMKGLQIDGNDFLEVYNTVSDLATMLRKDPQPILLECQTFRMRGHEEASGIKYVPKELLEEWAKKDPIARFEQQLMKLGALDDSTQKTIRAAIKAEIEEACEKAFAEPSIAADRVTEERDVYAPVAHEAGVTASTQTTTLRFVDAVSDGLREGLKRHQNLIFMGQDIGEYGGVFKVSEGFIQEFGAERIRNTPLCESAILGAALGLSIRGMKAVVEMQFADFVSCGFNQIVNNLAKSHYRWGQAADVVVRMPTGAGTGAGPYHSQSNEAWFCKTPGLRVLYPSSPEDAKGLLLAAIEEPNPVLFFEHKLLYRSVSGEVPQGFYTIPIGKARSLSIGKDASIITYGAGVHWALEYAKQHPEVSLDILDLRSLAPLDFEAIAQSVQRTHRVLVLHEDTLTAGIGAEIAAWIGQNCFQDLDAPVRRCASLDTPIPFTQNLEAQFLAKSRLESELEILLAF
jgi:2-oxoisovalerate dehydrogenase E1 component